MRDVCVFDMPRRSQTTQGLLQDNLKQSHVKVGFSPGQVGDSQEKD